MDRLSKCGQYPKTSTNQQSGASSSNISEHHFSFIDVEWNIRNQVDQFAYQVISGVLVLQPRPRTH